MTWMNKPWGNDTWALFDLSIDIGEQNDLSEREPERLAMMIEHWENYVLDNGVIENPNFYMRYSNDKNHYDEE